MASLKDLMEEKIHHRDLKISTYKAKDKCIIIEGQLIDNSLIETHHYSGKMRPAKTIHHMIIRLLIDSKLTIREVEVEMPAFPHEECPETQASLNDVIGMKISRGFTMKIKEMFSGGRGCSHLAELIISMAPTAVQGYWTAFTSEPLPDNLPDTMRLMLSDTCWVWRKDGPALKRVAESG